MENKNLENIKSLSLDSLEPREKECLDLVAKFKGLTIKGIDDVEGYKKVHEARMMMAKARTSIRKDGKSLRDLTNQFNKNVIAKENKLIGIIEPVEMDLFAQEENINKLKERATREALLPDRKEKLTSVEATLTDDQIMDMDGNEFQAFLNVAKHEQLVRQEAKIKAENDRIEAERKKLENDKREAQIREEEANRAREKATEDLRLAELKAKQDQERAIQEQKDRAEKDKQEAIAKAEREKQEALAKAEREKQAIIDENNRKEKARLDKEAADKKEAENKAAADKARKEREEKSKKFQDFLSTNGVTKENRSNFIVTAESDVTFLYKKIAEIKL